MDIERAMTIAASKLGYETLRAEQRLAIEAFTGGHDVFAALPTGFGKSLCFRANYNGWSTDKCPVTYTIDNTY